MLHIPQASGIHCTCKYQVIPTAGLINESRKVAGASNVKAGIGRFVSFCVTAVAWREWCDEPENTKGNEPRRVSCAEREMRMSETLEIQLQMSARVAL